MNMNHPEPRSNLNRPYPPPLAMPSNALRNGPRSPPADQYRSLRDQRDQRVSADSHYSEPRYDPRPEPRRDNYREDPHGRRSVERERERDRYDYERPPMRRNPSSQDRYSPSNAIRALNELETEVEETEIWRQIRTRAEKKSQSISSSRSGDSDTSRSRRSQDTPPSSAVSPSYSPFKNSDFGARTNESIKTSPTKSEKSTSSRREMETSTKATIPICRACDEPIRGRSLASQDGKLSGRYHKRCFCCTTCLKPFETASFYVFKDRPYCKRHYHELNHSCCSECEEGVEGQCLQLEDATIRHPSCFTCTVCSSL